MIYMRKYKRVVALGLLILSFIMFFATPWISLGLDRDQRNSVRSMRTELRNIDKDDYDELSDELYQYGIDLDVDKFIKDINYVVNVIVRGSITFPQAAKMLRFLSKMWADDNGLMSLMGVSMDTDDLETAGSAVKISMLVCNLLFWIVLVCFFFSGYLILKGRKSGPLPYMIADLVVMVLGIAAMIAVKAELKNALEENELLSAVSTSEVLPFHFSPAAVVGPAVAVLVFVFWMRVKEMPGAFSSAHTFGRRGMGNFDPITGQPVPGGSFDPMTGRPAGGYRFDPRTGRPVQRANFDPMTGRPVGGSNFDPRTGQPIRHEAQQSAMRFDPQTGRPVQRAPETRFDPQTGRPVQQAAPGVRFDPQTGEPVQQAAPGVRFDPQTGRPVQQAVPGVRFDPQTGRPVQQAAPEVRFDPQTGRPVQQAASEVKFDPQTGKPIGRMTPSDEKPLPKWDDSHGSDETDDSALNDEATKIFMK